MVSSICGAHLRASLGACTSPICHLNTAVYCVCRTGTCSGSIILTALYTWPLKSVLTHIQPTPQHTHTHARTDIKTEAHTRACTPTHTDTHSYQQSSHPPPCVRSRDRAQHSSINRVRTWGSSSGVHLPLTYPSPRPTPPPAPHPTTYTHPNPP